MGCGQHDIPKNFLFKKITKNTTLIFVQPKIKGLPLKKVQL